MQDQVPRRKLLLADDSVTIQKVVNLTFADEGIDVISVGDGDSALDMLQEGLPDIVLADVNMPGLTGYEICARIKDRDPASQIPVVLLVGSFEPFDEEEARRVGADAYLTKPFESIGQLIAKVSELLNLDSGDSIDGSDAENAVDFDAETPNFSSDYLSEGDIKVDRDELESLEQHVVRNEESGKFKGFDEREIVDFEDEDEFEMSEAFAEETAVEEFEGNVDDDQQIEEVTEDFLRTQPLTESDLQEILIDEDPQDPVGIGMGIQSESEYEETEVSNPFNPIVEEPPQVDFSQFEAASDD